jgi:hypothetical protein
VLKVSELIPNIADKTFHSTAYKNLVRILSKNQNNEGFQYTNPYPKFELMKSWKVGFV